jgi:hypothetical protein
MVLYVFTQGFKAAAEVGTPLSLFHGVQGQSSHIMCPPWMMCSTGDRRPFPHTPYLKSNQSWYCRSTPCYGDCGFHGANTWLTLIIKHPLLWRLVGRGKGHLPNSVHSTIQADEGMLNEIICLMKNVDHTISVVPALYKLFVWLFSHWAAVLAVVGVCVCVCVCVCACSALKTAYWPQGNDLSPTTHLSWIWAVEVCLLFGLG